MAGVGVMEENYLQANLVKVWRKRVVWLSCLFVAELLTFTVLAYFEHAIEKVVVLSLFIPLCLSTGGNSGSPAATPIIRPPRAGRGRDPCAGLAARAAARADARPDARGEPRGDRLPARGRHPGQSVNPRGYPASGVVAARGGDRAGGDGDLPVGHAGRLDAAA